MPRITPINPWTWQDRFGYSQAYEVTGAERVIYCAGQTSVDGEGRPLHAGNMVLQLIQALDNLEVVLTQAGLTLGNVVRLNYYVTDVQAYFAAAPHVEERLRDAGCRAPGSLLGVAALFHPDIVIELEATAVG